MSARFSRPFLYAGGVRCFVAADIIAEWERRGLGMAGSWWTLWRIAEDRRDYKAGEVMVAS